jgi:LAS superfamily LD-carboxypeptidase LdcB
MIQDEAITKFVNNKVAFSDKRYLPKNLQKITGEFLYDVKGNQKLRPEALSALQKLSKDFFTTFNINLKVVSAYRSYGYQE